MQIVQQVVRVCMNIFRYCFIAIVGLYILVLLYAVFGKDPVKWKELRPREYINSLTKNRTLQVIIILLTILGFISVVCSFAFSSTQMGAFFEKSNYSETYEATLYFHDKPIFCLVDMERETESDEGESYSSYLIKTIYLPYGHSIELDYEEYTPNRVNHYRLGEYSYDCQLVLNHPANEASFDLLNNTIVTNYGNCCANKQSDIFHFTDCPKVKSINKQNLIYFDDDTEAFVLGFEMCEDCKDRW